MQAPAFPEYELQRLAALRDHPDCAEVEINQIGLQQQQQYVDALREQTQRLQAILDHAIDGIITIDELGSVDSFNKAAERIFGYTSDEVLGHNVKMLMPNPYRDAHDSYLVLDLKPSVAST